MRVGILSIMFLFAAVTGWSQSTEIVKDVSSYWKVADGDRLEDYTGQAVHSIHLAIVDEFKGGVIFIKAPEGFALFVNGQLQLQPGSEFRLNVDSLLAVWAGTPLLSIFQKSNVKTLKTNLIYQAFTENENFLRESTHFSDFVIMSSILLFGFFVILFRSNTRLTSDYLNIAKVFSFQEREEATVTGRIGSSVNILFFVFVSLLGALLLIVIFNDTSRVLPFSNKIVSMSVTEVFVQWVLLSVFILVLLIGKLVLILSMTNLFGFKGVVRFQFFNFIRSLYISCALMGLVLVGYFIMDFKKPDFFYFLLASTCGLLILSILFLYFKLMTRTSSAGFHLFSYLCGSEIIPLMILIKVLLN